MRLPYKNITVFAGLVGNQPVLRTLPSGEATVSVRINSKSRYRDQAQEWQTVEEWATAVFYRRIAEEFDSFGIKPGDFIHVEGRRHTRKWTDGAGHEKVAHEIVVTDWHPVSTRPGKKPEVPTESNGPAKPAPASARAPAADSSAATRSALRTLA